MRRAAVLAGCALALGGCDAQSREAAVSVTSASLRPGVISLVVRNGTAEPARIAQVAVNDSFVDFHGPGAPLAPDTSGRLIVAYPWIRGDDYRIVVLLGTGRTVERELSG